MSYTYKDITICIPVFERDDFFYEAINSALHQTIKTKILVIDNCSSHDKFSEFCKKNNVDYVRNEENVGMVKNWNRCIELAETKWITILHDDDLLFPTFNENTLQALNSIPNLFAVAFEVSIGYEAPKLVFNKGIYDSYQVSHESFLKHGLTPFPGVVFDRKKALKLGPFDENFHPISDFDFWYRIISTGKVIKYNVVQAFYRVSKHQASNTTAQLMIDKSYVYRRKISRNLLEKILAKQATLNLLSYYEYTYNMKLKLPYRSLTRLLQKYKSFIKDFVFQNKLM